MRSKDTGIVGMAFHMLDRWLTQLSGLTPQRSIQAIETFWTHNESYNWLPFSSAKATAEERANEKALDMFDGKVVAMLEGMMVGMSLQRDRDASHQLGSPIAEHPTEPFDAVKQSKPLVTAEDVRKAAAELGMIVTEPNPAHYEPREKILFQGIEFVVDRVELDLEHGPVYHYRRKRDDE